MPHGPRQQNTAIAGAPFTHYQRLNTLRDLCGFRGRRKKPLESEGVMSLKRTKGRESRKSRTTGPGKGKTGHGKVVLASRSGAKLARTSPKLATAKLAPPKLALKSAPKPPTNPTTVKVAVVKPDTKSVVKSVVRPAVKLKEAGRVALAEVKAAKPERIHSHPTMCLHCHLIVEIFHERGADPVKGAWQCPRCGHKYLFSHWKIKRQARGKPEAA